MTTLAEIREALLRLALTVHGEFCASGWEACRICAADRALIAAIPADGVIVTPDSLARAIRRARQRPQVSCAVLHTDADGNQVPCPDGPRNDATAILAALAAERTAEFATLVRDHPDETFLCLPATRDRAALLVAGDALTALIAYAIDCGGGGGTGEEFAAIAAWKAATG